MMLAVLIPYSCLVAKTASSFLLTEWLFRQSKKNHLVTIHSRRTPLTQYRLASLLYLYRVIQNDCRVLTTCHTPWTSAPLQFLQMSEVQGAIYEGSQKIRLPILLPPNNFT
jgi:hypothetical protein